MESHVIIIRFTNFIFVLGLLQVRICNSPFSFSDKKDRLLVDAKCCAGVSVESHNTALDTMRAVQIDNL